MKENKKLYRIVFLGLFTAIAFALYMLEIPFVLSGAALRFDFSDIPALVGGLCFGPAFGIIVELLKNLLGFFARGFADQMGFGNVMNAIVGISFVLPFSLIYKNVHEKLGLVKTLTAASIVSFASTLLGGVVGNLFIAPLFFKLFMNMDVTREILFTFLASAEVLNAIKAGMLCAVSIPVCTLLLPRLKKISSVGQSY